MQDLSHPLEGEQQGVWLRSGLKQSPYRHAAAQRMEGAVAGDALHLGTHLQQSRGGHIVEWGKPTERLSGGVAR